MGYLKTIKTFEQFINEEYAAEREDKVNEEKEIKSDDDFREYATVILKKAHGEDFDETKAEEIIDGLLDKKEGDDYGAIVGMLQQSISESEEEEEEEEEGDDKPKAKDKDDDSDEEE